MNRSILTYTAVCLITATVANADHTYPAFDATVTGEGTTIILPPASGTFGGCYLTADWTTDTSAATSKQAFASEATWTLKINDCLIPLASTEPDPDAQPTIDPDTLIWYAKFPYQLELPLPGTLELQLILQQSTPGTSAIWQNVSVSLVEDSAAPATPPYSVDLGTLQPGTTLVTNTIAPYQVNWYKFKIDRAINAADGNFLTIHSLLSNIADGPFADGNDTELALYNWAGFLIATNDDLDTIDHRLLSILDFGTGQGNATPNYGDLPIDSCDEYLYDVPENYYYLVASGHDAYFGPSKFSVVGSETATGEMTVSFTTGYPTTDCDNNNIDDVLQTYTAPTTDCNNNKVPDSCDIASGTSIDCQPDGIPDECQLATDCNSNAIPDNCDIAQGLIIDCNTDGHADACQPSPLQPIFHDDFPTYQLDIDKWNDQSALEIAYQNVFNSPPRSIRVLPRQTMVTMPIDLSTASSPMIRLYWRCTGDGQLTIGFADDYAPYTELDTITSTAGSMDWHLYEAEIPAWARHETTYLFLETGRYDISSDYTEYWNIDDITIGVAPPDCNSNSIPDACDISQFGALDCNENQSPDSCDIASGIAQDYDSDGLLAECDPDVDGDGVANEADLCPQSPLNKPTNPVGGPMGDFDDSCDLDLDDYYFLEICLYLAGPDNDPGFADCTDFFDFNSDGDVDLQDFASFQVGFEP